MQLVIHPDGTVRCIYAEAIDLHQLGQLSIQRGSYVEPNEQGEWLVDLAPCGGLMLGPFSHRSEALAAEESWLLERWLPNSSTVISFDQERLALAIIA